MIETIINIVVALLLTLMTAISFVFAGLVFIILTIQIIFIVSSIRNLIINIISKIKGVFKHD